jgi:hypothetical protein
MQAIARWGNWFNQELYGSPTTLPWGIPIECQYRVQDLACAAYPFDTTRFHPLFLYESISGVLGALVLIWIGFHLRKRLRPGDLLLLFFVWYGIVRFTLESLRHANWTFEGYPVAQLVSLGFIIPSLLILAWRHRPGHPDDDPPTFPEIATWGALGRPVESALGAYGGTLDANETEPIAAEPDAAEPVAEIDGAEPDDGLDEPDDSEPPGVAG